MPRAHRTVLWLLVACSSAFLLFQLYYFRNYVSKPGPHILSRSGHLTPSDVQWQTVKTFLALARRYELTLFLADTAALTLLSHDALRQRDRLVREPHCSFLCTNRPITAFALHANLWKYEAGFLLAAEQKGFEVMELRGDDPAIGQSGHPIRKPDPAPLPAPPPTHIIQVVLDIPVFLQVVLDIPVFLQVVLDIPVFLQVVLDIPVFLQVVLDIPVFLQVVLDIPVLLQVVLDIPVFLQVVLDIPVFLQVVFLYERSGNYLWHGALRLKPEMDRRFAPFKLLDYGRHAGAYDRPELVLTVLDGLDVRIPRNVSRFLSEQKHARFLECRHRDARNFLQLYPDDSSPEAVEFRRKVKSLLHLAARTLAPLNIPFWLSSGTCLDLIERRAQARVSRIQQIEKDILRLGARLQGDETQSDSSDLPGAQSSSSRLEHEPANEASYSVPRRITSHLGTKASNPALYLLNDQSATRDVEMVYSLLSMLGTHDKDDMSRTLLAMSSSQDSCIAMRQSGCLPLLIQLLHGNDKDSLLLGNSRGSKEARARASAALHNIVHSQPDDKRGRREIRVLHLLEQVRHYCEECWSWQENHERGVDQEDNPMPSPVEHQICPAVCVLMKLSFDEEHRHAMNELGGLQAVAELLQVDCEMFGLSSDHYSGCMRAMVAQLKSDSEDLQQVIASVLRNLSWRADVNSKKTLREVGSVRALTGCALEVQKESTLKSVLSALWNLSAHCTENKADICSVDGALGFLVGTLTHRSHTNTLAIIESGGGILRNVSSLIATNEAHRQILRDHGCLPTLLQHLKSHSLTIVSNACGTLWNLSARDAKDQEALWELGAVGMLRNLIHSRHKMIAMGSAAALRNLMANRPARYKDASVVSPGAGAPSLHARKQKALFEELDAQQLSETFDNIDNLSPKAAPKSADGSKRTSEEPFARPVFPPSVRASSDSLNSVTSADGYGNRGKTKPSTEPFYSSDENGGNKCCVYRKYPADLAHKIRSANHMADDDGGELDTPINYSLKYSDEQLNSGRQSPSHRGAAESEEDEPLDARLRRRGDSAPKGNRMASAPPQRYVATATSNYSGEAAPEQPIDYSLKYGADVTRKPLFKPEESAPPSAPPPPPCSANKLRPPPPTKRPPPKGSQEAPQTYCVEDTPICFSRGSSLSSLSSEEEEEDGRKRRGGGSDYPTLPVSEKEEQQRQQKEAQSQTSSAAAAAAAAAASRGRRSHHHHHHVTSSGARTPKSPPEPPYAQETPLMFSRCTSVSSLDSFSTSSIASSVRSSEPCSGMPSGVVSPSDLPDSPGQTMPPSRAKTPPPPSSKQEKKKQEEESSADVMLHFATESTPHGFSRASSLSALSVDEPYIMAEMRKEEEEEASEEMKEREERKERKEREEREEEEEGQLDESDDDDDIEILEACIKRAMPKSSRKPKKQQQQQQPAPRKPSQLPVYKLLPPQGRSQSQQRKDGPSEEVPRIYCVEGTPLNFSTATSLSDLTIDSPPNEEAAPAAQSSNQSRGRGLGGGAS
ncbi:Adenomatous polyposis coli protein [Dissostichus eleginoides]|uniref:Adenomatous polyposis coli protein n=1 Tax=Dissostichus eleginoides TaxID=100907 RepID=A0AAD9BM12_DISEL|nr:Adenomatous polyposis coli protein [Dissostichus eleginoides]